jgi:hypothetical protein
MGNNDRVILTTEPESCWRRRPQGMGKTGYERRARNHSIIVQDGQRETTRKPMQLSARTNVEFYANKFQVVIELMEGNRPQPELASVSPAPSATRMGMRWPEDERNEHDLHGKVAGLPFVYSPEAR